MTKLKLNGKRGFVFHDACWSPLEQTFHPGPVPLAREFEVCDSVSMGIARDNINWGLRS